MNDITRNSIFDICKKYNDVFIIDTFNYIFKYYFANKALSVNKNGVEIPTGHFFGITRQILFLKEKFPNCAIVFAVDGHDESRSKINSEYKAGRVHEIEPMDYVKDILRFCSLVDGVYSCYDEDYEADDVVASISLTIKDLCERFNFKKNIYILSSDKDMYQLICDKGNCKIQSVKKWGYGDKWKEDTEFIDEMKVRETFNGVGPENLVKFRAITGDSSDNLKGYFRYRKANASIVAANFDFDVVNCKLVPKDGVEVLDSWSKFLSIITEDIEVFKKNYMIMKLKRFDFEIVPEYLKVSNENIHEILKDLDFYELNTYMSGVSRYSIFKDSIDSFVNSKFESGADDVIDSIKCDLSDLL